MLSLKELQDSFINNLGNVKILTREKEVKTFKMVFLIKREAYIYLKHRMPNELIDDYFRNLHKAELKWNWLQNYLLTEEISDEEVKLRILQNRLIILYNYLIKHNLRLVIAIAKRRYFHKGVQFLDLISEGVLGLVITIGKFDFTMECKFSTYSIHWVKQRMFRCVNENIRMVKLPMHIIGAMQEVQKLLEEDKESLREEKMSRYLRRISYLPKKKITLENDFKSNDHDSPSLQDSLEDVSIINDYQYFEMLRQRRQIVIILHDLKPIEERFVRLRYGLSRLGILKLEEIAVIFNLKVPTLKKLETSLVRKLKYKWKDLVRKNFF